MIRFAQLLGLIFFSTSIVAQNSTAYRWKVESKQIGSSLYEVTFTTAGNARWKLYAPAQDLNGVATAQLQFSDSAFRVRSVTDQSKVTSEKNDVFNMQVRYDEAPALWKVVVEINGAIPGDLHGELQYSYGKEMEFYQETFPFSVQLSGGSKTNIRIKIPSIDISRPVLNCGDKDTTDQTLGNSSPSG